MKAGLLSFLMMFCALGLQAQSIIYVSPDGTGDGSSWAAPTSLDGALAKAKAGDQIWMKGFEQISQQNQLYKAPVEGFVLRSGVKLYGGFEGTETSVSQRQTMGNASQMKYRSVLSGDTNGDDEVNASSFIFPQNPSRSDNAAHVLVMHAYRNATDNLNDGSLPTVVDGVTVSGGQATDFGGGIYVKGGSQGVAYAIERCFLLNNFALKGGGIYVDDNVGKTATLSVVNQCVLYNNVAGTIIGKENVGGGIYMAGAGNIINTSVFNNENGGVVLSKEAFLINSAVTRNTGGGVDMKETGISDAHVYNSVVWGNSFVFASETYKPVFRNSAYPNAEDINGNISLSINNRGDDSSPMFVAPSLKTSFDVEYDWRRNPYPLWSWKLAEGSTLIDRGNNDVYQTQAVSYNGPVETDLAGMTRIVGASIDMNPYEFQAVPQSRIRYVKPDGDNNNDGLSWGSAYKSVQKAINELAAQPGIPGEVWVQAGTYQPTDRLDGPTSPASFRMRDGISVYGGFAGTESSKAERVRNAASGQLWDYTNRTILQGSTYDGTNTWNPTDHKWSLNSESTHVVWFAPLDDRETFSMLTVLDGVTIEGGQAKLAGAFNYYGDRGAGVYLSGDNSYLSNCVVRNNVAPSEGGGIYQKGGRVLGCLVYNNSSETRGGGIYVDNAGLILQTMVTNNSAQDGGGVYLDNNGLQPDGMSHPEYQILSTSIVSNNTSVRNGAVYCNKGGIILQSTIAANECVTSTDVASDHASRTGGLYIDSYARVVNSVLWNNQIKGLKVQLYAANPTTEQVRFYYSAVANMNNIVWNNTWQQEMMALSEIYQDNTDESIIDPGFESANMPATAGVQPGIDKVTYFWQPVTGSNLRARGMSLGMLPNEVLIAPELDIQGRLFAQKPAVGAYRVEQTEIVPEKTDSYIRIYVNVECNNSDHNGATWATAYRSLSEAIEYMAGLTADEVGERSLEIYVMQGNAWPRYASVNLDPKTATVEVLPMASGQTLTIKGGFSSNELEYGTWAPLTYRTQINGNHEGKDIEAGLYHCITVENNAKVVFDGFHIINGYAASTANLKYGAGMLVRAGAEVTVKNTIFENNTAVEGAAIDARDAKLTLVNCVVNNNTNKLETASVINCPNLTMNHVTVVNNLGAAPAGMGTSSFAAGNTSGNTFNYASVGAEGYKNFANPTNKQGASLGFDTYLGGYSNFAPLTSSADAGNLINKASGTPTGLDQDIAGNERNLGGAPDLGAYEAKLPANGSVIYVTATGAGKMDGSSWENAIAGNLIYDVNNHKLVDGNIPTTDSRYIGFYDANARPYGETSGASKLFFEHLNEQNLTASNVNYKTETHDGVTHVTGASGINIRNNRKERYVGGLQYAVELAAANAVNDGVQRTVWVAGGTYTDYKGFVIRDKVDVLGGFPNVGTPGEEDREPLISQYIPAKASDVDLDKAKYETIIQIQETKPWTYNSNGNPGANPAANLPNYIRKPVLFQPDVCLPTKSPSGRESAYSYWNWGRSWGDWTNHWIYNGYGNSVPGSDEKASNTYRYNLGSTEQNGTYVEYRGATWDGFTIRHGFYTEYKANRDGGAGVRMFRGVTLQNCVVTDNYINAHNSSGRGAGIYCDGNNSKVVNCFVLNNANNSEDGLGGGIYMILGTSYNTMVANNYAKMHGGGIFIEDAMFYNNTVAFNKSDGTGGLHQYTASSGTMTTLKLYNTIFYGNTNRAIGVENVNNFNGAWNCYVQTSSSLDRAVQEKIHDSQIGTGLASPFESSNAQTDNNFRLNATTWCLNNGAEDLGNDYQGNPVELPYTDVDFTDRIKDCTVDIGAYERSNEENVKCDANGFYYVTENGSGTSDGSSLQNAACAMKLQEVLNAAGERVRNGATAIVKIAGYKDDKQFVYHANTLSNPDDPQSYTFVIPYGVTVEGGYDGLKTGTWTDADRNPKLYKTLLSAIAQEVGQDVNGYHTVTFGEKPEGWTAADDTTIIDGLYLIDGKATSMAGVGNPNTRGGGAIVPKWAHVRNCVIAQCEAIQGGGLYLLPGATVSGTLLMENRAEMGGGIYADGKDAAEDLRAHIISATITDNTASVMGGGFYLEDGAALTTNSVIWGNTAPSDKNISGAAALVISDKKFTQVVGEGAIELFYPFNHCFVESYEMPSNYENSSMESDDKLYFSADRTLKAYSELIKHGTPNQQKLVEVFQVAEKDMQGINRIQDVSNRIDVGAYAYDGGMIPLPKNSDEVVTKIFVNKASGTTAGENMDSYIGRSFYTALSWLDDALDYIERVRKVSGLENTLFEIYLTDGIYKPSNRRSDAATTPIDQRQNSYVIPEGVKIYGGFNGEEPYGYGITDTGDGKSLADIKGNENNRTALIESRDYSDLNGNGVKEPWELANQTILSGDINVSPTVKNAYHVVYSSVNTLTGIAEADRGVLLDGITVMDGETWHEMSPSLDKDEIGRGGAIYTNGVDYTLNGCRVMNCKGVRGGAIYSRNANLTIVGSVISGNGTVENAQTSDGQDIRGGAVYMSGYDKDISLKAINTLWANNETTGKGGAIATSNDRGFTGSVSVSLMNNTLVRNKAAEASAVYTTSNGNITNTVVWGGEETGAVKGALSAGITVRHSAADSELAGENNIRLNTVNMAVDGPRFVLPSAVAGVAYNSAESKWNPASISLLTDAGDGALEYASDDVTTATGAYVAWWEGTAFDGRSYMKNSDYKRYMGPSPLPGESGLPKKIDIGLYEYQYKTIFSEKDIIYVDTQERGNGSGDDWSNATSDLRGAIVALSNPTGGQKTDKIIRVRGGEYVQAQLYTGNEAYRAVLGTDEHLLTSLTIEGSYAENGKQNFSQPTLLRPSDIKPVDRMFYTQTNGKKLTVEGVTFQGAGVTGFDADNSGQVVLKNVAFRQNGTGAHVKNTGSGQTLIANTLFADGNTGLNAEGSNVTVVNATFAQNSVAAVEGDAVLYNSVAWKSGNDMTNNPENHNVNLGEADNGDIENGPNFADPENGNYMIRPSMNLLDAGSVEQYNSLMGTDAAANGNDLGNNPRLTGGNMDIGAYEYNAPLQPVVYVKTNVAVTDGSGTSWENPIKDLQGAIDLASIYAHSTDENAYVFVHRDVQNDTRNIRVNMSGVKIYGGMNDESGVDAQSILKARSSVLSDQMSAIEGLTISAENSVVDGFRISGNVEVTKGMLATSVLESATVNGTGIVYNSFVSGNLNGTGKAVNVTSPNPVQVTTEINVAESVPTVGYVTDNIWNRQLKEDNPLIDSGTDIQEYIRLAGHEEDLSGAPRVRNQADGGCFEAWNFTADATLDADNMPGGKHVVYVRKGTELDIAPGLFPDGKNFNVGFLLLEHGAGLRGNGNAISLTNFAVERSLDESNSRWDMAFMPFEITGTEGADGVRVMVYNGARRAAYDYKFSNTEGAWEPVSRVEGFTGMLLEADADARIRMYGKVYQEKAGQKGHIKLQQYNNMEAWTKPDDPSLKFTHMENMGWNLFGSPFLCAMNYEDMEYGRVIYQKNGNTYEAVNTADQTLGAVGAGSAVFTQTATAAASETVPVDQRTGEIASANGRNRLAVALAPLGQDEQDAMLLTAVPAEEASAEFNMAADGVKVMSAGDAPQIYMQRNSKYYAMLTALDIEGEVEIGTYLPESGSYSIFIPEDCVADDYETVVLKDKATGKVVDLLEGAYNFQVADSGTVAGRFVLSFNNMSEDEMNRIQIEDLGDGNVAIRGLAAGDRIFVYDEAGMTRTTAEARSETMTLKLRPGFCLFRIADKNGHETVRKIILRP